MEGALFPLFKSLPNTLFLLFKRMHCFNVLNYSKILIHFSAKAAILFLTNVYSYRKCNHFLLLFFSNWASRAFFWRCDVRIAALLTVLAWGLSFNITCRFFSGFFLRIALLGLGLKKEQRNKPLKMKGRGLSIDPGLNIFRVFLSHAC